mmetsp:Transcript_25745/g.89663  ORF Transcript_25745/g.89663 Transcript_25745/m.89663 type:complete len:114 (-) Transcript_25745:93-434(-)
MAAPPIYVRAKRQNETVFLSCEPGDTMMLLKTKLQEITGTDATSIRILGLDRLTIFEDESTVADHQLKDNAIVYFVFKGEHGDTYEDVKPHMFADSDVPDPATLEEGGDESKK